MTEYQALRKAGETAGQEYRRLERHATEIAEDCIDRGQLHHAAYWRASARDWQRRADVEKLLLHALEAGGPPRWRETVIALKPKDTEAMLRDLGVTTAPARWVH